jgi:dTDP-4-amino-4,6-dideoxygalactose transaminase
MRLIGKAVRGDQLSGNGANARRCHAWIEDRVGSARAFLTHSCTAALEMAALLLDLDPGDEVLMPSFTFVSTANAVCLRGAVPVFVDIRPDTLNLDESRLEEAITGRTRAIVPVHYAGVACAMDPILEIARTHGLAVIEDAAQAVLAKYRGRPLGSLGDLATLSFHETKNLHCGEGGALLVNRPDWIERAEIAWEKGTNRNEFFRGEVDRYTWVALGSSFLPSELEASFLLAQFEEADRIVAHRRQIWESYHQAFADLESAGRVRRPIIPGDCDHNGHLYYLLAGSAYERDRLLQWLRERGVRAVFHYVPLHSAPAGRRYGRAVGELPRTDDLSGRLLRLPLWVGMTSVEIDRVVDVVEGFYR